MPEKNVSIEYKKVFTKYSKDGAKLGLCVSADDLCHEYEQGLFIWAHAEDSGCEGTYVEVAVWSDARTRWERYAFAKLLRGDDGYPERSTQEAARALAAWINANGLENDPSIVHDMPDFEG